MTTLSHIRPRSSARGLKAFVIVVCLVILGLEGWRDWGEREQEIARISAEALNLAKSLTQHAQDTFELADSLLVDVVDRVETGGIGQNALQRLDTFLVERVQSLQRIKSLTIYGEDGTLLSSSLPGHRGRVNGKDLAFFQHHLSSSSSDWFFGPLIRDPLGGDWVLTLSRRINKPDGSFDGVVQASVPPRYFANFFGRFDVGSQGSITLIHKNGTILARYPYIERSIGADISDHPQFRREEARGLTSMCLPSTGLPAWAAISATTSFPSASCPRSGGTKRWRAGTRISCSASSASSFSS